MDPLSSSGNVGRKLDVARIWAKGGQDVPEGARQRVAIVVPEHPEGFDKCLRRTLKEMSNPGSFESVDSPGAGEARRRVRYDRGERYTRKDVEGKVR